MREDCSLSLSFGPQIDLTVRKRITYAFRLFCAVYGFSPVEDGTAPRLCYGTSPTSTRDIFLKSTYEARNKTRPAPRPYFTGLDPRIVRNGTPESRFPCFHASSEGAKPDWLGEIFEWISGAHECSITTTDPVARIPYTETVHGKYGLDPLIPYAAVAMRGLNCDIRNVVGDQWPATPLKPWVGSHHLAIAATHDIDFLPLSFGQNIQRLIRDTGIAAIVHQDPPLTLTTIFACFKGLFDWPSALDRLRPTLDREKDLGIRSTYNFIGRRAHRRDANYDITDPRLRPIFDELTRAGIEIGVHGSYTSLETKGRLAEEYEAFRKAGYPVVGGRQHWLRYKNYSDLCVELKDANAWYDCSFGYSSQPGFRYGACFPFPPYDIENESAYPLLELPLVLMDNPLFLRNGDTMSPLHLCETVMDATRAYGWGGTSILWHNFIPNATHVPQHIEELYWRIKRENDQWMSAVELVKTVWPRYAKVGILPDKPPLV